MVVAVIVVEAVAVMVGVVLEAVVGAVMVW